MLPEGWKETTLGKCVKIYSGYAPQIVDPKDDGTYPYVKVDDLNNCDKYQKNSKQYFFDEKYCIPLMSVIFPKRGAAIMNNKVRIAATHIGLDTNMMAVYPISSVCHTEFIYYFIKYSGLYRIADISSIPQINNKHILPYKINLPPLSEQKKIAAILSTWDKAISTADAMLENSHQQKKALMQQLLTGKRRLPGFKGEWCFLQAKKLFNSISIKHRPEEQLLAVTQDDGVVPRALLDRRVAMPEGDVDNYKFVKKGDFIISLRSFQGGIEYSNYNGLVSPAYTIIEKRCDIDDAFYRHYFKSSLFIGKLAIAVIGIRDGKQISYDDFAGIPLPVPPLDEQRAIAAVLDAADREIALLEQKAARLREEKKALMQQLLTGKRRVRV